MTLATMVCLALAAQESTLNLESKPPGATVAVGGLEGSWTTPCSVRVPSGRPVEVRVSRKGFETLVRRLSLKAGVRASVTFTLVPRAEIRVEEAAGPAQAAVDEPVRVRVSSPGGAVRVSAGGKIVAEVDVRPGVPQEFLVPSGPVRVDHLEAAGGAPTHTVEILPSRPGADREPQGRAGEVQLVHSVYGVYLKLDSGSTLVPGEEISLFRDGQEVARSRVLRVIGRDETYPNGAAQVARPEQPIRKGDEARRLK